MKSGSSLSNQFVANAARKWQVGDGAVQVPEFSAADSEFNPAEAMIVGGHTYLGISYTKWMFENQGGMFPKCNRQRFPGEENPDPFVFGRDDQGNEILYGGAP